MQRALSPTSQRPAPSPGSRRPPPRPRHGLGRVRFHLFDRVHDRRHGRADAQFPVATRKKHANTDEAIFFPGANFPLCPCRKPHLDFFFGLSERHFRADAFGIINGVRMQDFPIGIFMCMWIVNVIFEPIERISPAACPEIRTSPGNYPSRTGCRNPRYPRGHIVAFPGRRQSVAGTRS